MSLEERITSMNQIIDRFYRLLKSAKLDREDPPVDTDYTEAWKELDDFLKDKSSSGNNTGKPDIPSILREDYRILGVEFGASFNVVKKEYIFLVKKHHPDKFADNPDRQKKANEKIKSINISYNRIKAWESAKSGN